MKVSVICVYNDKSCYESELRSSLKHQDIDYEILAIDNREKAFNSAAEALNYGANRAKGDILVFSHQDIYLKREKELRLFAEAIEKEPCGVIIGTQGVKEPSNVYYSNITAGKEYVGSVVKDYEEKMYEVSSVDEGFFGMKKATWDMLKFNETLCDNWHLYGVEICLHTRKAGGHVYVWPSQLHHFSMGNISLGYMRNLKELCKYYHKDFKYIWTTCYKVKTNFLYMECLYLAWVLNRFFRRRLY